MKREINGIPVVHKRTQILPAVQLLGTWMIVQMSAT